MPPEVWTSSNNVRFFEGFVQKILGSQVALGTPSVEPAHLLHVPGTAESYWLYLSKTKAYVYSSGVHSNITRQTAAVDVDYTTVNERDWNGGILGGIPILNNGVDVPQYWPAIASGTKLADITNFPADTVAKIVRPFGPFLVMLDVLTNGSHYPHMFWWSHPAEVGALPSSWDVTDPTKDAGRRELTDVEGGVLMEALMLGDYLILYKETSTHLMRYVGGRQIMASSMVFATAGILGPRCVCAFDLGRKHFVVGQDDIMVHNSREPELVLEAKYKRRFFEELSVEHKLNTFVFHKASNKEVWVCYPTKDSADGFPNKAMIWNYQYNTIQFRDFVGMFAWPGKNQLTTATQWDLLTRTWDEATEQWSQEGDRGIIVADPANTRLYQIDAGADFFGTNYTAFVERLGLSIIGRDRSGNPKLNFTQNRLVKRLWPKMKGTGTVAIQVGFQDTPMGAVTWSPAKTFDAETGLDTVFGNRYVDFELSGRLPAVRFESSGTGGWQLDGYDIDITPLGEN
jgi:hypothetical protein